MPKVTQLVSVHAPVRTRADSEAVPGTEGTQVSEMVEKFEG